MEHAINTLENERRSIEQFIRNQDLMRKDMTAASELFRKIAEIKKAIKVLKSRR